jgi:hypothetical protein
MVLLWVVLNCLLVAFALVLGGAVPSRERHPLSEKWDGRAGGYGFRTENSWWGDFISFNFMSFLLLTPITFVLWCLGARGRGLSSRRACRCRNSHCGLD